MGIGMRALGFGAGGFFDFKKGRTKILFPLVWPQLLSF
jgi:hypothetical protein